MSKPEILSEEQIKDAIWNACVRHKEVNGGRVIAQAQRDADVEWLREDSKQLALECHKSANRRVEQARREVAEEIFEELDKPCLSHKVRTERRCLDCYASIKAKYLE